MLKAGFEQLWDIFKPDRPGDYGDTKGGDPNVKLAEGPSGPVKPIVKIIDKSAKLYKLIKAAKVGGNLSKSQLKSISSLESQITSHEQKLAEYIKDPMKFDNKGFLKNAPNEAIRQKIIQSRINHLQQEIKTFQNNILDILSGQ
jgi:hypothetical protein